MNDDRSAQLSKFRDRLITVEPLSPASKERLQEELHAMFVRQLSTRRRIVFGVVATVALASSAVCGLLAATETSLPALARVGLGTGTFFGLAWTAVAARLCWRGVLDLKHDSRRIATMVWVFTVLMMVFFLAMGMSVQDRLLGIMMMANGLAYLIGAGIYWLSYRVEEAELATREKLLQIELSLAELSERLGPSA